MMFDRITGYVLTAIIGVSVAYFGAHLAAYLIG